VLITSTGEGTIGRVDLYPYEESAIADGHVAIVRLKSLVNIQYIVEFLRSEYGQIQMLRFVSGSTGQTELLIEHIRRLSVPLPALDVQQAIVDQMEEARVTGEGLGKEAEGLRAERANILAIARRDMMKRLAESGGEGG